MCVWGLDAMVQPEPGGFVAPADVQESCHPGGMASIPAARSLPYGVGRVSQQLLCPEQPVRDSRALGQEHRKSLHPSPGVYFPPWHQNQGCVYKQHMASRACGLGPR